MSRDLLKPGVSPHKILLDYVLFTALFQTITNVKRLKPRQIKAVGWVKERSDESTIDQRGFVTSFLNPPHDWVHMGYDPNGYNRLCLVHNQKILCVS